MNIKIENGIGYLQDNFIYELPHNTVFIPKHFIFDLGIVLSIELFIEYKLPFLVYSWLISVGSVTYKDAANIFLDLAKKEGMSIWQRLPIYWAIRLYEPFHRVQPTNREHWRRVQYLQQQLINYNSLTPTL